MFLVAGAQKCATSWLYLCLADHPELRLPDRKREVEYLGGAIHRERGDAWYLELVGRAGHAATSAQPRRPLLGDVSVEYLYDPASPREVARLLPDVQVVVSLRDPVGRAVSAWTWYRRKGTLPGSRTLAADLEAGADWLERTDAGRHAEVWPTPGEPEELVARGCYDVQLERWITEAVPPDRLLVLDYAALARSPEATLSAIWRFLGVGDHRPEKLDERPKRNTYRPWLARLERLAPRNRPWAALLDRIQRLLPGRVEPTAALPESLRARLEAAFAPSRDRTASLLGRLPRDRRPDRPSFCLPPDPPADG